MEEEGAPNYREVRLRDLRPMDVRMMVVGRVVRAERRMVARRSDQQTRPVLAGLLTDGTATVRFSWWDPPEEGVEPGTILRAANVLVREFRGRPELSFTSRTRVVPADASELPSTSGAEIPLVPVADVRRDSEGFRLEVRVAKVRTKDVRVRGEPRTIFEGLLSDASGEVPFTAWSDLALREGAAVRVTGAVGREFQGRPQVVLDDRCTIDPLPDELVPPSREPGGPTTIDAVEASGGSVVAVLEGTVVAVLPPSGVVHRCPQCHRTMTGGDCRTHGTVAGVVDLRARLVVDDGTGAATVELGRSPVESMLGRSLDELVRAGPDFARSELLDRWFGRHVRASGRAVRNEFGLTLFSDVPVERLPPSELAVAPLRRALDGLGT